MHPLDRPPARPVRRERVAVPGRSGQAASRTQTLRFFDKPVSITLTHPGGTVVAHAPYPEPRPGDTMDVDSLAYAGTHHHHDKRWIGSSHLRCTIPQRRAGL